MALKTGIEWTEATWNPLTGCSKISTGCKHCYAERLALRLKAMGNPHYSNGFELTLHEEALTLPLIWRKPQMIFVNSMSDLFHERVPLAFIKRVFATMQDAHWHRFQVLTKRSSRLAELSRLLPWPSNVWMGVTVEDSSAKVRIDHLRCTPARVKFLSVEPLLGPLGRTDLEGIDWVIVGGESGPGARPMNPEWVANIRDQCANGGVPFFFKQWGGVNRRKSGREFEGRTWDDMPVCAATGQ